MIAVYIYRAPKVGIALAIPFFGEVYKFFLPS